MSDRNARILSSIGKVEKARFNYRAFGAFLFLFSLGLALHARSSSIQLKLPIGLFDSGLHNGYTLIFGPAAILIVVIAAYFQRRSFVSLQEKVQLDIKNAKLSDQLTELEKRELHGSNGVFAWLANVGPFAAAAICAVTITWVFGDFQYPFVKVSEHEQLQTQLGEDKRKYLNVFEPYTIGAVYDSDSKKLSVVEINKLLDQKKLDHIKRDNWSLLFFGPPNGYPEPYSPAHDRISQKNYSTSPSIDHLQAWGHLFATITTCIIAVCVAIPKSTFTKLKEFTFRLLKNTSSKNQGE